MVQFIRVDGLLDRGKSCGDGRICHSKRNLLQIIPSPPGILVQKYSRSPFRLCLELLVLVLNSRVPVLRTLFTLSWVRFCRGSRPRGTKTKTTTPHLQILTAKDDAPASSPGKKARGKEAGKVDADRVLSEYRRGRHSPPQALIPSAAAQQGNLHKKVRKSPSTSSLSVPNCIQ